MRLCPSSARWRTAERAPRYWSIDTMSGLRREVDEAATTGMLRSRPAHRLEHPDIDDDEDDRVDPLAEEAFDDLAQPCGIRIAAS